MKKVNFIISSLFLLFLMGFQSCIEDSCKEIRTFTFYEPIYSSLDSIRNVPIVSSAPREMEKTGKLYFYKNYIFVNEKDKGIHIIDNNTPHNPINTAFIEIPGNVDMAIKGDVLYADSYRDMLAINIEDISTPILKKRIEDVYSQYALNYENRLLVTGYKKTDKTVTKKCSTDEYWWTAEDGIFLGNSFSTDATVSPSSIPTNSPTGIAGSMARFGLYNNYLYAIDKHQLQVFDISTLEQPNLANTVSVGWGIETIFPHGNHLFIGANDGMYIFDNSTPTAPSQTSKFKHARACDPVYVVGNKAYVTLRDGNACQGYNNQLDIVNISNLENPHLIKTHQMQHPHGLSVRPNHTLFLCEGVHGVKILDVSNDNNINLLGQINDIHAFDVIALSDGHILVIGQDGLYQFDTSNPSEPQQLSVIKSRP